MTKPAVVITGASTGIGYAAVACAVRAGMFVFGSVRKGEDGERLRGEFGEDFEPLVFDVREEQGVAAAAAMVASRIGNRCLGGLINNAGVAVTGPLLHVPIAAVEEQFAINVFGVLRVTQAFAPLLGTDRMREGERGRIVNVSSVSGKLAFPFAGPYVASKHALEGMSDCLRRELLLFGVDTIVVGPGAIRTPIWEKASFAAYAATEYAPMLARVEKVMREAGEKGLEAEECGELLVKILRVRRPRARYALVRNALVNWYVPRLLPARWLDRIIAGRLGIGG